MKRILAVSLALAFLFSTLATADEGMWLYNEAPKAKIKAKGPYINNSINSGT